MVCIIFLFFWLIMVALRHGFQNVTLPSLTFIIRMMDKENRTLNYRCICINFVLKIWIELFQASLLSIWKLKKLAYFIDETQFFCQSLRIPCCQRTLKIFHQNSCQTQQRTKGLKYKGSLIMLNSIKTCVEVSHWSNRVWKQRETYWISKLMFFCLFNSILPKLYCRLSWKSHYWPNISSLFLSRGDQNQHVTTHHAGKMWQDAELFWDEKAEWVKKAFHLLKNYQSLHHRDT